MTHPLVQRLLKRSGVADPGAPPGTASWTRFLESIGRAFHDADQERYLLERSLTISSREMQALYRSQAMEHEKLGVILSSIGDGLCAMDSEGRALLANPEAERLLGWSDAELRGVDVLERLGLTASGRGVSGRLLCDVLREGRTFRDEDASFARCDGGRIPVSYTLNPLRSKGEIQGAVLVFRDITDRKRTEETLRYQARHDSLTRLPNRFFLQERLRDSIEAAGARGEPLSLLLIDLDRFKEVNDSLGHTKGDGLLREIARRASAVVRGADSVARLGGDEFAVLLPGCGTSTARRVAERLLRAVGAPVDVDGHALLISASIGIATLEPGADDATALLRRSDVAMYVAKRAGGGCAVYSPELDENSIDRLAMIAELKRAIEGDELVLHYQPTLDLRTGELACAEVLVRWRHPARGLVPPDEFIPMAEQTGLIRPLSAWVLDAAIKQGREWLDAGLEIVLAVNVSMRNLHEQDLPGQVAAALDRWGMDPRFLNLEVTETALLVDVERTIENLKLLQRMGVRVAIDDFGAGHTALGYLKRFPVDKVKIDKSFVKGMMRSGEDATIVKAAIELGHGLGLSVVAEGVEDRETWDALARLGCDIAQGYFISRPIPAEDVPAWLATARIPGFRPGSPAERDAA
ncbi:EAL domain-containing protein [Myxococcota bacterium]|nr:EAL domain-containing protein [Myxococcota bacterium]